VIWFKVLSVLLGLLDFISRQVERAQFKAAGKTEAERDTLKETVDAMRNDKALEDRLRRNPALFNRLRRRYNRQ